MTKKYYIDFTTLVVDDKSFNKITSDNFNRKEFFKQLIDDDILLVRMKLMSMMKLMTCQNTWEMDDD